MTFAEAYILIISCIFLYSGLGIHAFFYDYSATTECLAKPLVKGSDTGNRLILAYNQSRLSDNFSQKVEFQKGKLYSFSAWIKISEGSETVAVVFRAANGESTHGGYVIAKNGCWSLLKGGMVSHFSGPVEILFQCKNTTVEIFVDNVSLQPFTMKQWRSHQEKSIQKKHKSKVRLQATYANKTALKGAIISIKQTKSGFPFGCGVNHNILTSKDYQNWFSSRFKFATFTNEMKWYSTETKEGQENYSIADSMLQFAKTNGISVRGHNILWEDPKMQPQWVQKLSSEELGKAVIRRVNSVATRYSGQLIAWDVVNENLHFNYFESKLGNVNASAEFYARAYQIDSRTRMFMNEYNTIEDSRDQRANPVNYVKKITEIIAFPGNTGILAGIGAQGHFGPDQPNLVYMRSALDILGSTGLPIWLTEVDVDKGPNQAKYFEQILWEGYSHPAVEGIIIFGGPEIAGFKVLTLADTNFKNTEAGNVVDKLIAEWKTKTTEVVTDSEGFVEVSVFHGDYELIVKHPETNASNIINYKVKQEKLETIVNLSILD